MLGKVFTITQKAVKISKFLSLIADTVKYFHEQGLERGLFGSENPDISIAVKSENQDAE